VQPLLSWLTCCCATLVADRMVDLLEVRAKPLCSCPAHNRLMPSAGLQPAPNLPLRNLSAIHHHLFTCSIYPQALEDFKVASSSARGDMDLVPLEAAPVTAGGVLSGPAGSSGRFSSTMPQDSSTSASGSAGVSGLNGWPLAVSIPIFGSIPVPGGAVGLSLLESTPMGRAVSSALLTAAGARPSSATSQTREALRFILSPEGSEAQMHQCLHAAELCGMLASCRAVPVLPAQSVNLGPPTLALCLQARSSGSLSWMSWSSQ
jgi:hypothetical protein